MATETPTNNKSVNFSDMFVTKNETYVPVKALGFDFYEMPETGLKAKLYELYEATAEDAQKFGFVPKTYEIAPKLVNALKEIKAWPVVFECIIVTKPGSKNKSTSEIVAIKGF